MADQDSFESVMAERRRAAAAKSQGGTTTPGAAPAAEEPGVAGTAADIAKGFGSGVERGAVATAGLPGDVAHAMITLQNWMRRKLGPEGLGVPGVQGQPLSDEGSEFLPPTSQEVISAATPYVPGIDYQPQTKAGQYAQTAGEFAPAAVLPGQLAVRGATTAARVARGATDLALQAVAPGVAAQGAGDLAKGTALEPYAGPAAAVATSLATGRIPTPRAATPLPGYHPGAVERVNRAIVDEGGHAAVAGELQTLGQEGRLIDAGPNLQLQGEALVSMPGQAQSEILRTVRERNAAAGDRVSGAVNRNLGDAGNYDAETQRLIADRRRTANDLYTQARSTGPGSMNVDTSAAIRHIEQTMPTAVVADATRATDLERPLLGIRAQLQNRTDVASLHNLKESIDDQIGSALRNNQGALASRLRDVQSELVGALDRATEVAPGQSLYRQARQQYAGDSAVLNAREEGLGVFNRDVRPNTLAREQLGRSDAERRAFQQGAREQVEILMDNARNDALSVRQLFQKGGNREKLIQVIGEGPANDLIRFLESETRLAGTSHRMTSASATAGRQAAQKEFPTTVGQAPPWPSLTELPTRVAQAGWKATAGPLVDMLTQARRGAINRDVGRILTAPGASQSDLLEQLRIAYGQAGARPGGLIQAPLAARSAIDQERPPLQITVNPRRP